jgi:intermediate peptidase
MASLLRCAQRRMLHPSLSIHRTILSTLSTPPLTASIIGVPLRIRRCDLAADSTSIHSTVQSRIGSRWNSSWSSRLTSLGRRAAAGLTPSSLPRSNVTNPPLPTGDEAEDPTVWHPLLGMFGSALRQPSDWAPLATRTHALCEMHVSALLEEPPSLLTLQRMDEVSNLLCSVIDVAELCKSVHTDARWREAAAATSASLVDYMTSLNHHAGLRNRVAAVTERDDFTTAFSPEAQRVARTLKEEMDANGVGAAPEVRQAISALLGEIHQQTHTYMSAMQGAPPDEDDPVDPIPPPKYIQLHAPRSVITAIPNQLPQDWKHVVSFHGNSTAARMPLESADVMLRYLQSEELRKQVYMQHHSAVLLQRPGRALETVLYARQELSHILGSPNYTHYAVDRCVAKSPKHVENVLTTILQTLQTNDNNNNKSNENNSSFHPRALTERRMLQASKMLSLNPLLEKQYSSHYDAIDDLLTRFPTEVLSTPLHPWDSEFLLHRVRSSLISPALSHSLSHYFTIANVLVGYSVLLDKLFGIECRQVQLTKEEDWTLGMSGRATDELIKLELWEKDKNNNNDNNTSTSVDGPSNYPIHTGEPLPTFTSSATASTSSTSSSSSSPRRMLGVIYLDLFHRPNKFHNAASFNFRSGRQKFFQINNGIPVLRNDATTTEAGTDNGDSNSPPHPPRQMAVVGIVSVLGRPILRSGLSARQLSHSSSISLLSLSDVEMLFHELGHCLHNIFSNTKFQHVAGARGELDFVELPSTLFENFVSDPEFISLWAKHYQTDISMPSILLNELIKAKNAFRYTDMIHQVIQALFDQKVHSLQIQQTQQQNSDLNNVSSMDRIPGELLKQMHPIWEELQRKYSPWQMEPVQQQTNSNAVSPIFSSLSPSSPPQPYIRQVHLLSYGASYYCYIYCRIFASVLWRIHFSHKPLSYIAGNKLRNQLFAHGGGLDPEEILRILVNIPEKQSVQEFVEQQLHVFLTQNQQQINQNNMQTIFNADDSIAQKEATSKLMSDANLGAKHAA